MTSSVPPNEQPRRRNRSLTQSSLERPGTLRGLIERTMLTWRLFWDKRVGIGPKLIPIAGLIYLISPIDLLPAWLIAPLAPVLAPIGVLDDIGIILLALNLFIQVIPPDIVKEHQRELGGSPKDSDDDVIEGSARPFDE